MNAVVFTLLIVFALCVAGRMAQSRTGFVALILLLFVFVLPAVGWKAAVHQQRAAAVRAEEEAIRAQTAAVEAARRARPEAAKEEQPDDAADEKTTSAEADRPTAETKPAAEATVAVEASTDIQIEPEPGRVIIPPRPKWVEAAPVLEGDVHTIAVSSGPHETLPECDRALDRQIERAVDEYVDGHFGTEYRGRLQPSEVLGYDAAYARAHLLGSTPIYKEVVKVSFGPMQQVHALLHFDTAFRQKLDDRRGELDARLQQETVMGRLAIVALALGGCLALLLVVWAYFKLDHVTRGYYSGRLQLVSVVAILGLLVVGVFLARYI